jgi:Undecaprenyl-phosphate glucose phosphotransferase
MELDVAMSPIDVRSEQRNGIQPQHLAYLSTALDFALLVASGFTAHRWSASFVGATDGSAAVLPLLEAMTGGFIVVIFAICAHIAKLHDPLSLATTEATLRILRASMCFVIPPLAALLIALPFSGTSAAAGQLTIWLEWVTAGSIAVAVISRLALIGALAAFGRTLFVPQRIAIVGSGEAARRMIRWIEATAPRLVQIIGVFDDRGQDRVSDADVAGKLRGNTSDLIKLYQSAQFDKIVIALPHSAEDRLLQLLRRLRQLPVDIALAPDLMGFRSLHQGHAEVAGLKLYSLAHRPIREPQRLLKGFIDRSLAALGLLALSPLLLLVTIAIKLDSRGPVLFRQPRQGLGDTLFDVFKFRTMHVALTDTDGAQQTRRDDPRITRLGAWLRRSSIDELPQLLNVLRGEMSLVGPRPHAPHMLVGGKRIFDLVDEYSFRHRVKPGITGLAQVNGSRGAIDTPEQLRARIDYDLYYIDHWSLWLDLQIMLRTAAICVSGVNAY